MSAKGRHVILEQQFDITMVNQELAAPVQEGISSLQKSAIADLLNEIFDMYGSERFNYIFQKIELDLGTVSIHTYGTEIVERLRTQLTVFFEQNILENGELRKGEKVAVSGSLMDSFRYFLHRGYFAWDSDLKMGPHSLFLTLLDQEPDDLRKLLISEGIHEKVRLRLISALPTKSLEKLVLLLASQDSEYVLVSKQQITLQAKKYAPLIAKSSFEKQLWYIILGYLLSNSGSFFNRKSFLKYIIQKVAAKYSINYNEVLQLLMKAIDNLEVGGQYQFEFKKIVTELSLENRTSKDSVDNKETAAIEEVLRVLDYFFQRQNFSSVTDVYSEIEISKKLVYLFKTKSRSVQTYIAKWMLIDESRNMFLQFVPRENYYQLIGFLPEDYTRKLENFMRLLEDASKLTVKHSRGFFREISRHKEELMIRSYNARALKKQEWLQQFLQEGLVVMSLEKQSYFDFLLDINEHLPKHFSKTVSKFLDSFCTDIGKRLLEHSALKIVTILKAIPERYRLYWFEKNKNELLESTQFTISQFMMHYIKLMEPVSGAKMVVELFKSASVLQSDTTSAGNQRGGNSLIGATKKVELDFTFSYVMEKGLLPWWTPSFDTMAFNSRAARFISEKKGLIKFGKQLNSETSFKGIQLLTLTNFSDLLRKLSHKKPSEAYINNALEFLVFFEEVLYPLNYVNKEKVRLLRNTLFKGVIVKNQNVFFQHIESTIRDNVQINELERGLFLQQLILDLLRKHVGRWGEGNSYFKSIAEIATSFDIQDSEKETSTSYHARSLVETTAIITNAINSIKVAPHKGKKFLKLLYLTFENSPLAFKLVLAKESTRKDLISNLALDQQIELVTHILDTNNRQVFLKSMSFIKRYESKLSKKQFDMVVQSFMNLMLLYTGTGQAHWKIEDYAKSIHQSFTAQFTSEETNKLLFGEVMPKSQGTTQQATSGLLDVIYEQQATNLDSKKAKDEKVDYIKLGEEKEYEFLDPIFVMYAGIVIVAPHLVALFDRCGYMEKGVFKDSEAKYGAYNLLQFVVQGDQPFDETENVLFKLLCGIPLHEVIVVDMDISTDKKELVNSMLYAITQMCEPLKHTTVDGLRSTFLVRNGKLQIEEDVNYLSVEQAAYDILLDQLPWSIEMINLSWMDKPLKTQWR